MKFDSGSNHPPSQYLPGGPGLLSILAPTNSYVHNSPLFLENGFLRSTRDQSLEEDENPNDDPKVKIYFFENSPL